MFARDLQLAILPGNVARWATASKKQGETRLCAFDSRPTWQQLLEAIFILRHPSPSHGESFQKCVRPAQGMGTRGRAEEINAYLALLSRTVVVKEIRLLT